VEWVNHEATLAALPSFGTGGRRHIGKEIAGWCDSAVGTELDELLTKNVCMIDNNLAEIEPGFTPSTRYAVRAFLNCKAIGKRR
jgi:hypothetical protein